MGFLSVVILIPQSREKNLSLYLHLRPGSDKRRCFASLNMRDQLWHGRTRICVGRL